MVVVCSVLVKTVYTAPRKAVASCWPLSTVPLCIHSLTVSTDEGELVWTVSSMELQRDIEGRCEMQKDKVYVNSLQQNVTIYIQSTRITKNTLCYTATIFWCNCNQATLNKIEWLEDKYFNSCTRDHHHWHHLMMYGGAYKTKALLLTSDTSICSVCLTNHW